MVKHFLFEHWFAPGTSMWFVEFMQQALYHPQWGYYTTHPTVLGRAGDFITAPELTPLFGTTLAKGCAAFMRMEHPVLFEFGAGSGKLCIDLLQALEQLNSLPEHYMILEVSGHLRMQQEQAIKQAIPHLFDRLTWIETWPTMPFNGVIIANEVLDAMPVHRLMNTGAAILESRIEHEVTAAGPSLVERWEPCPHPRLVERMQAYTSGDPEPYVSEINGLLEDWLRQVGQMLKQGAVFLIDYGFPAHEYYHPDRSMGTLMCHDRHFAHANPLIHVGEQDITAHVDFTHVAQAADVAQLDVAWFGSQAAFLLENGILDLVAPLSSQARFTAIQGLQRLISPSEMGELFKVMVLTKAFSYTLSERYDARGRL